MKFPADFERCVRQGGRVRTISGPNKEHGVGKGEYVKYCYLNNKSYRGEVKTKSKQASELRKLSSLIDVSGEKFGEETEIEVLHSGRWEHPQYGEIIITEQDIDRFVKSFKQQVRKVDLAVDQEHMPEKGAAGWFKELWKENEDGKIKLKAKVNWTPVGEELIKNGIFKYFSPEFEFQYEDQETHDVFENVLLGGALTNRPYFKDLSPVMLSENVYAGFAEYKCECVKCGYKTTSEKHCRDIKCPKCGGEMRRAGRPGAGIETKEQNSNEKGGEDKMLTKEELKSKLAEDENFKLAEDASEEEVKLFEEVKAELADSGEEQEEGNDTEVKGSEKFISKADHVKQMNELKSQLGVVEKRLKFKEVQEEVKGYVFSESNPNGVLLPKNSKLATEILMSANSKTEKLFKEFLGELPKVSNKLFEEQGGDSEEEPGVNEIQSQAQKMVEDGKANTYGEAIKLLREEKPELFK